MKTSNLTNSSLPTHNKQGLLNTLFNIVTKDGQPLFNQSKQDEIYSLFSIEDQHPLLSSVFDNDESDSDISTEDSIDEIVYPTT